MPRQFGPTSRPPWARTSASSRSWRSRPSAPTSAKPEEMTQSARAPAASASSAAARTSPPGRETTTNLLSGLLLTLAQRPDVFTRLREHPELIPAAIEEQLRFVSPVQGFYRTATRDYTVGAQTIPAGARVLLLFAAANRDPRRFDDPDTFDLNRNPSNHLAFGGGIHYCLGTPLSRLEASRVFSPKLRLFSGVI